MLQFKKKKKDILGLSGSAIQITQELINLLKEKPYNFKFRIEWRKPKNLETQELEDNSSQKNPLFFIYHKKSSATLANIIS